MKRTTILLAAALAVASATAVEAAPFASLIRVGTTNVPAATGTSIAYVLNEAADTVTIEILDGSNTVVATFAGTTTIGANSVSWNGTANNGGGAALPTGTGYKVRISAAKAAAAGYAQITSAGSTISSPAAAKNALEPNYFCKDLAIQQDETSDHFGTVLVSMGYSGASAGPIVDASGFFVLNTALDVVGGGTGLSSRVLKHPADDGVIGGGTTPDSYAVWGAAWDGNRFFACGQNATVPNFLTADGSGALPAVLSEADPTALLGGNLPRNVAIQSYSSTKYAFLTFGNATVRVLTLDSNGIATAKVDNILLLATTTRYSKAVRFDAAGNMYFVSRRTSGTTGGSVYRWSAAQVQAAIANAAVNPLTEANAQWALTCSADPEGVAIGVTILPNGDVIYLDSDSGIYNLGNSSTASLTGTLPGTGTQILAPASFVNGANILEFAANIANDKFGNLYITDGRNEVVQSISPGGTSNTSVTAPTSQTFAIGADVSDWSVY